MRSLVRVDAKVACVDEWVEHQDQCHNRHDCRGEEPIGLFDLGQNVKGLLESAGRVHGERQSLDGVVEAAALALGLPLDASAPVAVGCVPTDAKKDHDDQKR